MERIPIESNGGERDFEKELSEMKVFLLSAQNNIRMFEGNRNKQTAWACIASTASAVITFERLTSEHPRDVARLLSDGPVKDRFTSLVEEIQSVGAILFVKEEVKNGDAYPSKEEAETAIQQLEGALIRLKLYFAGI
ncbi:MAG: hypothetical protein COV91_06440 [Candidatus Taylorbacteria bacterium CG11_big_fil_rev_8_21_14_0_20_46_11]|uniref:Uncharacterized protein n=1 Tax=Candidatus Taylorbacteria bacterium CG11_big_fil_rev_8_21_14_0_20_46_11 TaxID=1975025 RepID=A0A2H0K9U0_9BACT|nr:MAG: hypothetical protein COV91_06440 [Candidatus Taylorbacteria bacterium CG11_big_fil_rev_8_21_14_0_20_46_11]